eukprot:m.336460 g.336460  ORF g.336460 m.336460 type:complete len:852 (-) comp17859_c0_seq1:114-2669(-)
MASRVGASSPGTIFGPKGRPSSPHLFAAHSKEPNIANYIRSHRNGKRRGPGGLTNILMLPSGFLKRISDTYGDASNMVVELRRREETVLAQGNDWKPLKTYLEYMVESLTVAHTADEPVNQDGGTTTRRLDGTVETIRKSFSLRDAFVHCDGIQAVSRVLFHAYKGGCHHGAHSSWIKTANMCMAILRSLCETASVASDLFSNSQLKQVLFALLSKPATFASSAALIEEMLAGSGKVFEISEIQNFSVLARELPDSHLALLCRAFALLVYDSSEVSFGTENMGMAKQEMHEVGSQNSHIVDRNHEIFANNPELIARLVSLLHSGTTDPVMKELMQSPDFIAWFWSALTLDESAGVLPQNIEVPYDTVAGMHDMQNPVPLGSAVNSHSHQGLMSTGSSSPAVRRAAARMQSTRPDSSPQLARAVRNTPSQDTMATPRPRDPNTFTFQTVNGNFDVRSFSLTLFQVEVIFVLCTLAGGKYKKQIQKLLADNGLGPILNNLFDCIEWTKSPETPNSMSLYGAGCECNESALRIQYLRLVRNFCENTDLLQIKRTLFTSNESEELQTIQRKYNLEPTEDIAEPSQICDNKGLILKILESLQISCEDNSHKVFMASALEGYLRGAPVADKLFFVEHGLLAYIVSEILVLADGTSQSLMQSFFDLLGEMLKFSREVCLTLESHLDVDQCELLIRLSTDRLVSSNVFIRSLYLTAEKYDMNQKDCRLMFMFHSLVDRARLIVSLISCLSVPDLNQENVCCLNTAIVFLIHAQRRAQLHELLKLVADTQGIPNGRDTMWNLHSLVSFWQFFYRSPKRAQDCEALQRSSQIPFTEWLHVVIEILLGDKQHKTSLNYWLLV